ncbi:hypothetical protein GS501_07890 [Saccharibacter sp. 17.LH.SD]|uniref:hypothetical protein n=1 Tax=Saccharibacter sp. 17.LH.SD TaxID=2689393 RepID=UPI0013A03D37|nr:hypothetical protein [Saccharibacter sp. 17.LH.SD]MXV44958.1 hypothetical protein [Saccharibacter sp. 17.LH.SD]
MTLRFTRFTLALLISQLGFTITAKATCQPQAINRYDFPVQRLDEALQDLSHRSGCPIHVTPEALKDRQAATLHGRYHAFTALRRLLRHNPELKAEIVKDGFLVRDVQHKT